MLTSQSLSSVPQLHSWRQPEASRVGGLGSAGTAAQRRPLPAAVQDALPYCHSRPVNHQLLRYNRAMKRSVYGKWLSDAG